MQYQSSPIAPVDASASQTDGYTVRTSSDNSKKLFVSFFHPLQTG